MQAQNHYETIFEKHPVGIALLEIHSSKIANCNSAFANSIGYTKEELIGQPMHLIHGKELTNTISNFSKQEKIAILHHKHKNGSLVDKEVRIQTLSENNNELLLCYDRIIPVHLDSKNSLENISSGKLEKMHNELLQRQFAIDEHVIIGITDISGTILYVNNQCCIISKYSKEELIGKTHRILKSNYHEKKFWKDMYGTLKTGKTWIGEIRNKAKDGSHYWIATRIVPLKNETGEIEQYLSINTDITEKKQIEEKLHLNQIKLELQNNELIRAQKELEIARSRYFDLYYLAPIGYFTINKNNNILEANLTASGMLGVPRKALTKLQLTNFIFKDDIYIYQMHCNLLNETGNPQSFELRMLKNNGTKFWARLESTSAKDNGGLPQFFVTMIDITKRKQTEEALKESETKFHAVFDQAPLGIALIESATGRYMQVNPKFCEILGYSDEEILNKSFIDITHPDDVKTSLDNWQSLATKETKLISFEKRYIKKNGTVIWTNLTHVKQFHKNENTSYHLVIVLDITDTKRANEILKNYTRELENINQTKDKFFGIIAHDLRNPFAGILGITEILDIKMKEELMNESVKLYHKYIQMVQSSAQSAFNLLENLMQWARSQTGEISVRPKNTSLNFLLSYTIPIVSGSAFKKSISIEKDLSENDIVYADESLVSTILRNLLTNSIKFTKPNGKIFISTKCNDNFLEISIKDTGVGIEPEVLGKLFKIESKFSKPGTENEKGTGLGLILSKEFVEKQGGTIWAESQFGQGSTFTFTLPQGR